MEINGNRLLDVVCFKVKVEEIEIITAKETFYKTIERVGCGLVGKNGSIADAHGRECRGKEIGYALGIVDLEFVLFECEIENKFALAGAKRWQIFPFDNFCAFGSGSFRCIVIFDFIPNISNPSLFQCRKIVAKLHPSFFSGTFRQTSEFGIMDIIG